MSWSGPTDAPASTRIAAIGHSLLPAEKRVVETVAADVSRAVESTAQEIAELAQVSRASVVRAAQSLGYEGYPQLRVALARELAVEAPTDLADTAPSLERLRRSVDAFAAYLPRATGLLSAEVLTATVDHLARANRVLVVGNGLSSPVAMDAAMRLNSVGRSAEFAPEALSQQIVANQLGQGAVCLVLSGSGSNRLTLEATQAAKASGAQVIGITSFLSSPLAELADYLLVAPSSGSSFLDELEHTSRVVHMLFMECLVDLVGRELADRQQGVRQAIFSVLGRALSE